MFDNCNNLESLNLAGWDVTELEYVVDLDAAFSQNENIKEIDIAG
ncbi:MAG: hypothetical protein MJ246_01990 [Clostridia bacterium]|nr:hypothetical protein [Clostridia bacterium]